jgi:hypothetical protein
MTAWADLSRSQSARVKALDAWWQSCAGDSLPDRADFDPSTFAHLLPFLLLSEVERPFRLRYRLIGAAVRDVAGSNFAGRYLDEMMPAGAEEEPWLDHYRTSYETARPLYGSCRIRTLSGGHTEYEFGIWPLAHRDGGQGNGASNGAAVVRQFIAIEDYGNWRGRVRPLRDELADWQYALHAGTGGAGSRPSR